MLTTASNFSYSRLVRVALLRLSRREIRGVYLYTPSTIQRTYDIRKSASEQLRGLWPARDKQPSVPSERVRRVSQNEQYPGDGRNLPEVPHTSSKGAGPYTQVHVASSASTRGQRLRDQAYDPYVYLYGAERVSTTPMYPTPTSSPGAYRSHRAGKYYRSSYSNKSLQYDVHEASA